jgi:UDP-N-acetylglucosamine/UDP-N-acetylgalactosamine diphosphorylase
MMTVPADLHERLRKHGQEHVVAWWERLSDPERKELLDQLNALNLDQLRQLYTQKDKSYRLPSMERISPIPVVRPDAGGEQARRRGEESLRHGEVAVLMVAGGQGSRLGFEHPKGMFGIGPVTNKCLFQIHAEKVLALSRRYGRAIPFLVMTSPATDAETQAFFKEHRYYGLPADQVHFFCQGTMPALDMETGKLLMEAPGRLFASPNGHGGTLTALADSGLLDRLRRQGIQHIFYFQVDNPLVEVADPQFLGQHLAAGSLWARWLSACWSEVKLPGKHPLAGAEASSKVVPKEGPADKLGNLVLVDDRCTIIEYSDLSPAQAGRTDQSGQLFFWAGSPAIHIFTVDFLSRVTQGETRMPFHVARKKVPHLDAQGQRVEPVKENALKFELFIFDVLPMADRWTVVEANRAEEFAPLKNGSGPDSPGTVRQAMSNLAADWLEKAGVHVPRTANGDAAVPLEISPLFALDADELAAKLNRGMSIQKPTYLEQAASATHHP